jgi:hypothetical protein
LLHSCHHAFIFVLMYWFTFISASRKRPLSFESILDSISKPKLCRSLSKIIAFHFWKISLVSKSDLNLILIRNRILNRSSEKPNFSNLHDLNFELNFKIVSIQKSQNPKGWFSKRFKLHFKFPKPCFSLFSLFFDLKPLV